MIDMSLSIADQWDRESESYKKGKNALEEWHNRCRRRRIEERIAAIRKAKGIESIKQDQKNLRNDKNEIED